MHSFALNHMTVARLGFDELLDLAASLGCVGVELRNDLPGPLFDGLRPAVAGERLRARGLRLLSVAEIARFDDWSDETAQAAQSLIGQAAEAGAEAISLIPRNDGTGRGNGERQANLRLALRGLAPMLQEAGLIGLIEPLGFESSSVRLKSEVIAAIDGLGLGDRFQLIHDTFHHPLAAAPQVYPDRTGLVHISGVTDTGCAPRDMTDPLRGLVDGADRLGTLAQIAGLRGAGYAGPISFECFAPDVHSLDDPRAALARSMEHIRTGLLALAA